MYASETFGRLFWVDDNFEFKSCPLCIDGTGDFDATDYVSEWEDWEGVDYNKLFNIHKFCILNKINYAGSLTYKEVKSKMNVYNDCHPLGKVFVHCNVMINTAIFYDQVSSK